MSRTVHLSISIALTILIAYIIYRGVPDWRQSFDVMLDGRPLLLMAGFGFVMLHMVFRALRWGVLLSPIKTGISAKNLFSLTLVKYVVNVVPPRAGEIAASVALAKKESMSAASVIAASVLERILDILTVMVIFGVYLILFAHRYTPGSERGELIFLTIQKYSGVGFLLLCLGFVALTFLLRSERWLNWMPSRIQRLAWCFLEGFRALQSRKAMLRVVFLSLAIWVSIVTQLWLLVLAYLEAFPYSGSLLLVVMTVFGVAIPTPGGIGGFQFFMSLSLTQFFSRYLSSPDLYSQAVGISNGCYIVSMVPVIVIGLIFLNREGLSLSRISKMSTQV